MEYLFFILILISPILLIAGLIKPGIFSRFSDKEATRKKVGLFFGGLFLLSFILFGMTADPIEETDPESDLVEEEMTDEVEEESSDIEIEEDEDAEEEEEYVSDEDPVEESTPEEEDNENEVVEPDPGPEDVDDEEEEDSLTLGEENALRSAQDYLSFTSFSREGLIQQLEYEGYTNEEAVYAVDNSDADWYEQAEKSAEDYLDYTSFSREGLIEQLEYEGFTRDQAEHGVEAVGY